MTRKALVESIAHTIRDYREGEIASRTPEIVDAWIGQFDRGLQIPVLEAIDYVLKQTYISQGNFREFLTGLAVTDKLCPGKNPSDFWRDSHILNIQGGGSSQNEIREMFDEILQEKYGFSVEESGVANGEYIYLDDCIGTGSRVRADICNWLGKIEDERIVMHIITPIMYAGSWWIDEKIYEHARKFGKTITLHKWRLEKFILENRLRYKNRADVLWPTSIPGDFDVIIYEDYLRLKGHEVVLRNSGDCGASGIYKDDEQKILLEQILLIRGCVISNSQERLPEKVRPLGYHNLDCLGFGSMFVTYRNCPNNCPLAFWVEQDDYPALFPRKTNSQSQVKRMFERL